MMSGPTTIHKCSFFVHSEISFWDWYEDENPCPPPPVFDLSESTHRSGSAIFLRTLALLFHAELPSTSVKPEFKLRQSVSAMSIEN